jgi:hypothetical protein
MHRVLKHLAAIVALPVAAGCVGGSSCAGATPLPESFKNSSRIENAGALRLTDEGFNFLEKNPAVVATLLLPGNAGGGLQTFEIPTSSQANFTPPGCESYRKGATTFSAFLRSSTLQ